MNIMKEATIRPLHWMGGDCPNCCIGCPFFKSIDLENGIWKITCELEDNED